MGEMQPTRSKGGVVSPPSYSSGEALIDKTSTVVKGNTVRQPVTTPEDPSGHGTSLPQGSSKYGNR